MSECERYGRTKDEPKLINSIHKARRLTLKLATQRPLGAGDSRGMDRDPAWEPERQSRRERSEG